MKKSGKRVKTRKTGRSANNWNSRLSGKLCHLVMIVLTFILAGMLGFSFLGRYMNPENAVLFPALGYWAMYLWIANLIMFFVWLFKWKVWTVFPAVSLFVGFHCISTMVKPDFSEEKLPCDLKIATLNVGGFEGQDKWEQVHEILNYADRNNVNVLCLQEFGTADSHFGDSARESFRLKFKYEYVPDDEEGRMDLAVLSKHPMASRSIVRLKKTSSRALWCDIVKGNDTIRIFNVHLDAGGGAVPPSDAWHVAAKDRARQALAISKEVKRSKLPVILCGEFGDVPTSFSYGCIADVLSDGFDECGIGSASTNGWLSRTNYIFTDKNEFNGEFYVTSSLMENLHRPVMMGLSY